MDNYQKPTPEEQAEVTAWEARRAEERRRKLDKTARVSATLQAVTELLHGWMYEPPTLDEYGLKQWHTIKNETTPGMELHIRHDMDAERLSITGAWPEYIHPETHERATSYPRTEERIAITTSATREPRAMAADIQRRFIPQYTAQYMEHAAELSDQIEAQRAAYTAARNIAAAMDTTPAPQGQYTSKNRMAYEWHAEKYNLHIRAEIRQYHASKPAMVKLTLDDLTEQEAHRLIRTIKEWRK